MTRTIDVERLLSAIREQHEKAMEVWRGEENHSSPLTYMAALTWVQDEVRKGTFDPQPSEGIAPEFVSSITNCPVCGSRVGVSSSNEGTHHYVPLNAQPEGWISVEKEFPPRHQDVWCLNRDGFQFQGRICSGMHKPFFTYPHGDGNASNTAPAWIDVTHWMPLPQPPTPEQGGRG